MQKHLNLFFGLLSRLNFQKKMITVSLFIMMTIPFFSIAQNNAFNFDGNDDFIEVPSASSLVAGSTELSMSCWVYPGNNSISWPDFDGILGFRNDTDADFYIVQFTPTEIEVRFRNSTGTNFDIIYNGLVSNTWQLFTVTYNGNVLTLYKDGVSVGSTAASGTFSTNANQSFFIGKLHYSAYTFFLKGSIDEVGLWDRALTASEVNTMYNQCVNSNDPSLQLYYKFNQGIAGGNNTGINVVNDEMGNISGQIQGSPSLTGFTSNWVSSSPAICSTPNEWTGVTSSDWNMVTNWSEGSVPTATETVIIPTNPSGAFFPITSANITVADLTIQTGASLTIGSGFGLIIAQDGTIANSGAVTLEANASGSAWLDDFTNTNTTYTGNLTVKQYITTGSGLGQRFFGSPIANGVVQGLDATYAGGGNGQLVVTNCASVQAAVGSPYSNLFEWHEDAVSPNNCEYEAWYAINASTALTNGRGYSGWMNDGSTISFTGPPNTGNVSYGGSLTNSASGISNIDGWHLVSNPYPSAMIPNSLTTNGWSSLQTYNGASGAYGGTFQPITPMQEISVAQGFVGKIDAVGISSSINAFEALGVSGSLFEYSLGTKFTVSAGNSITIDKLGAFDHNIDGILGNITVLVYSYATGATVPGLITTITGSSNALEGNFRMQTLGSAVTIPAGDYMIYAYGFTNIDVAGYYDNVVIQNPITGISYQSDYYYYGVGLPNNYIGNQAWYAGNFSILTSPSQATSANFTNIMRTQGGTQFSSSNNWFTSKLNIEVSSQSGLKDISFLYFNNDATANFDNQWDCEKRESDAGKPTLFTKINAQQISLNGNASSELGNQNFPLGLKSGSNGTFTFSFSGKETFPANTTIYVKDLFLNTVHNIENEDYTFTSNTTDNADRFEIIFVPEVEFMATKVDCQMNDAKLVLENLNNIANRTYEISANSLVLNYGDLTDLNTVELAAGNYKLTVVDQFGGTQIYDFVVESTETIAASLEVSNTEVFVGDAVSLNNTTPNSNHVVWSIENTTIGAVNNLTYSFETAGTYEVEMNVSNADCSDLKAIIINVANKTTAIKTLDGEEISFYPNPVNNVLNIRSTKAINIEIVDVLGKKVVITSKKVINLENVTTGVYFIKIYDESNRLIGTEKIVKK